MGDDLQRVAEALGVPLGWLVGFVLAAGGALLGTAAGQGEALGLVAAGCGLGIGLIGIRAMVRPSRPFRLENLSNTPWINTSRRVGAFYVVVGVVWTALALMAALGSASIGA